MAPGAHFELKYTLYVQNRLALSAGERILCRLEPKNTRSRYLYAMIQQVLIGLLFAGALVFLTILLVRSFRSRQGGCATGCGKCEAAEATPKP